MTAVAVMIWALGILAVVYVFYALILELNGGSTTVIDAPPTATRKQRYRRHSGVPQSEDENLQNFALAVAAEVDLSEKRSELTSRMTLERELRYAKWDITPVQFRSIQAFVTLSSFLVVQAYLTIFLQLTTLFLIPRLMRSFLRRAMRRRVAAFDKDYAVMLLQYVSMVKSGLTAISGLEAVAKGLDENSLVRAEIELLIERLRLGLREEDAISAFGEDIGHPEIELFVQCLLIHRRVGGTLSSSLERLAEQVRKRQQFRMQAEAAVGMERASTYVIVLVLGSLLAYLLWFSPELMLPAFTHPRGQRVFQASLALVLLGFYWASRVTDIKI